MLLKEKYIQNCQAYFGLPECEWFKGQSRSTIKYLKSTKHPVQLATYYELTIQWKFWNSDKSLKKWYAVN